MIRLQHIIALPDWEPVPDDPEEAIRYMAQWDYGEYHSDPDEVETIYTRNGHTYTHDGYVLYIYYDGTKALYRIVEGGGTE